MSDLERSIEAMKRKPWKYWDSRTLEEVAYQLLDFLKRIDSLSKSTDLRLTFLQEHLDNSRRAVTELLAVIGFPNTIVHPTTQPVGMGEESAP